MGYHLTNTDDSRSATRHLGVIPKPHRGPKTDRVLSTKYTDSETGLIYYGARYYQSETGRWCSRDPLEENFSISTKKISKRIVYDLSHSGANLYVGLGNDAENRIDLYGQSIIPLPESVQAACLAAFFSIALADKTKNGDWRHCYVTCQGDKWCGPVTDVDGLLYELLQLLGGTLGSGGNLDELERELREFLNDMKANIYGQKCSRNYFESCDCCCAKKYPK